MMDKLDPRLKAAMTGAGYLDPTPIQRESWEKILAGGDLLARAPTGTGKTAAFLVPIIQKAVGDPEFVAVVIEPSRELAIQAANECRKLAGSTGVRAVAAYGGTPSARQEELIRNGAQVVIGTPGRLKGLVQSGTLKPGRVKLLVLDEADRLTGEQFIKDVTHLASRVGGGRQTLLFCVQMPADSLSIADKFLKPAYAQVKVGTVSGDTVTHYYVVSSEKIRALSKMISGHKSKSIVFCSTAQTAREVVKGLRFHGIRPILLHSQLDSSLRNDAVRRFAQGLAPVLVATDLAARGMHFAGVSRVYSYDFPAKPDFYLHRAGRTGRMGCRGECVSLLHEGELGRLKQVLSAFGVTATEIKP